MNLSQITILLSNTISFSLGFTCIAYVLTLSLTTKKNLIRQIIFLVWELPT